MASKTTSEGKQKEIVYLPFETLAGLLTMNYHKLIVAVPLGSPEHCGNQIYRRFGLLAPVETAQDPLRRIWGLDRPSCAVATLAI